MKSDWGALEDRRLDLQKTLDALKTGEQRNELGQFATPTQLAREIAAHGLELLGASEPIRFLDPGIGTGSFYSALRFVAGDRPIESATGFEVDDHYGDPARTLWRKRGLTIRRGDFTRHRPSKEERVNLLIANPPYVRHHHLAADDKARLVFETEQACGIRMNGLGGLYCYFLGLSHSWMEDDGVAAWLIPSEFMDVNYGRQVKRYLTSKVTLLQVHRFDPTEGQFADALVSSAIVWIRKTKPSTDHVVRFTFGGSLAHPHLSRDVPIKELTDTAKWTRYPAAAGMKKEAKLTLGDLFKVRRGIATGDNNFFILTRDEILEKGLPFECFRPVLPSSRYIKGDVIEANHDGTPILARQEFLLDTRMPEAEIEKKYPALWAYLQTGKQGVADRYLCKGRSPWYAQEQRAAAPIICTYMGRSRNGGKPFRFILNHSQATACNVYLMLYPEPPLAKLFERNPTLKTRVWEFLSGISTEELIGEGRVYGGGLHKLEPKELKALSMDKLAPELFGIATESQLPPDLFSVATAA